VTKGEAIHLDRVAEVSKGVVDPVVGKAREALGAADKRMLKLIRAFLKAGVMEDGLVSAVDEGTPQRSAFAVAQ
jgi:hypothetical protein